MPSFRKTILYLVITLEIGILGSLLSGCENRVGLPKELSLEFEEQQVDFVLWSPSRNIIAATVQGYQYYSLVYLIDSETMEAELLLKTDYYGGWITPVAWSPDGQTLYFSVKTGSEFKHGIWGINIDDPLPRAEYLTDAQSLAVSKDGVFVIRRGGTSGKASEVFLFDPESSEEILVYVDYAYQLSWLVWSADGEAILIVGREPSESTQYFLKILDLESQTILTIEEASAGSQPSWFPNGDFIAYVAQIGNRQRQITIVDRTGKCKLGLFNPGEFSSPSWSPNGDRIAYVEEGKLRISIVPDVVTIMFESSSEICP